MKCMLVQLLASKCSQTVESVTESVTGAKTLDQRFGANLKKPVFLQDFAANLLLFCVLSAFQQKNAENDFFDQCLGCVEPNAG